MAQFWTYQGENESWNPHPVPDSEWLCVRIDPESGQLILEKQGAPEEQREWPQIKSSPPASGTVLMHAEDARLLINGRRGDGGIRVLRDRDELILQGARLYYSTESLAEKVMFQPPGGDPDLKTFCARCKDQLLPGTPAVRCPSCGAWHHQQEEEDRPCWTYSATCARCAHPTPFDQGYQWTPALL